MSDDDASSLFGASTAKPVPLVRALGAQAGHRQIERLFDVDPRTLERERSRRELERQRDDALREAKTVRDEVAAADELARRYEDSIAGLAAAAAEWKVAVARDVVELSIAIAREWVGVAVANDPDKVVSLVQEALGEAFEAGMSLRLSPCDASHLRESRPELAEQLTVVDDDELKPGGFALETTDRIIDGTLERRLESIRAALAEALTHEDGDD